jgi:hypothetical protein
VARGMSCCRICGKPVHSVYRRWHEKVLCLKMRFERGDPDVAFPDVLHFYSNG